MPLTSPSPDVRWRATQEAAQELLAWDLGAATELGQSMGLAVLGAGARTYQLQGYMGGVWTTVVTLDLGADFAGLTYTRTGDTIRPNTASTAAAARYVQAGELVGGFVILGSVARRIVANTAGRWATGAAVPPTIRIEIEGAEPGSGTCTIVAPGGVAVAHATAPSSAQLWRVRVAPQVTPGGVGGAGVVLVGAVRPLGAAPDWGWSEDVAAAIQRARSPYGTPRTRKLGPARRRWAWSWGDGTSLTVLRGTTEADYYARSGAIGGVHQDDAWWQLRAAVESHGHLPVVALRRIPDGSISDPTLWCYGELASGLGARGMRGTEGADEWVRLENLAIEEIK
jgi:hypothetical protein